MRIRGGTGSGAGAALVAVLAVGSVPGCDPGGRDHLPGAERWASSEGVPFTQSPFVRLVGDDRACLIDSFESQVVCGGPGWREVERFGREGRGPGEFYALQGIAPLPTGGFGIVDFGNRRVTLLSPGLRVDGTIPFDGYPSLVRGAVDSALRVVESETGQWIPGNPAAGRTARIARVGLESGTLQWDTLVVPEAAGADGVRMAAGAWSPVHGYVFLQLPYRLIRFSPVGEFLGILTPGHYQPELPSDRDVEARISDLTQLFGQPPGAASIEEWRTTPKQGVIGVQHVTFSEDGLLWIAATRDRTDWSYIDVYSDGGRTYLGSVRVRDRLLAFDVRGGTLAALVEHEDPRGDPSNRIDWYRIGSSGRIADPGADARGVSGAPARERAPSPGQHVSSGPRTG